MSILRASLVVLLWSMPVEAQQSVDQAAAHLLSATNGAPAAAEAADDEWLSAIDRSWDPSYSQSWYETWGPAEGPWQLSVVGGARSSDYQTVSSAGARLVRGQELYALAQLQIPLADLPLLASRGRTQRAVMTSPSGGAGAAFQDATDLQPLRAGAAASTALTQSPGDDSNELPVEAGEEPHDIAGDSRRGDASEYEAADFSRQPDGAGAPSDSAHGDEEVLAEQRLLRLFAQLNRHVQTAGGSQLAAQRLASLMRRARRSGLVPELRLRGVLGFDSTTSAEDVSAVYPGQTSIRGGRDSLLEARLTFRLDRLVYGDQETALFRQRADLEERMERRIAAARKALLTWLGTGRRLASADLLPDEELECELAHNAALVELYWLSDGWFRGRVTLRELGAESLLKASQASEASGAGAAD